MSFPAYPQYKNSGIESLGEIPNHWDVTRLPYVVFDNNAGEVIDKNFWGEGTELLYTCAKQPLLSDYKDFPVRKRTGESDLLLTRNGTPYVHLPIQGSIYSNVVQRVSLIPSMDRNFMRAALDVATRDLVGYGVSIASFNYEMWTALRIPLPVCEEQTQIARFLGHETACIDALIEEQQCLIELLKEKRQAVISHAVTKGLDPTVPMKDSGVEWLGEVPAHWDFKQSKYLFEFVTSGSRGWAEFYADDGDLFFRIANLTRDSIEPKLATLQYVNPPSNAEGERSKVRLNDILISITADLGSVCVANEAVVGSYVSQHVALARPMSKSVFGRWLAYFVLSTTCKDQLVGAGYGGTKVQLSLDDIRTFWVSVPPYEEQLSLVAFLDKEIKAFDGLIVQASIGVDLLSERRSALISAAVTGKIDVRSWQPPTCAQAPELELEAV